MKKQLRKTLRQSKWALWVPLARLVGRIRRRRQIVSIWPEGEITLGPRVAVFMHFDGHGQVRTQVQRYLEELRRNGRSIVFVSNSETPAPTAMAVAQRLCDAVIMRRNIGYDFGAWADALDALGLPRAGTEEIIFANDSVLGPLLPLGDILRRLDYAHADVWGLTESWQQQHHLQSYFLAFGPAALAAPAFQKFWASVRPVPLKIFIVRAYEVGITQAMRKGGLRCEALWPYHELLRKAVNEGLGPLAEAEATELGRNDPLHVTRKLHALRIRDGQARRVALNPTSDLWRQLLLSGFPFIKRELLGRNPSKVQDIGDWMEVVRDTLGGDPEPIIRELRGVLKDCPP